eukprot:2941960-Rhodomonas_salina.2
MLLPGSLDDARALFRIQVPTPFSLCIRSPKPSTDVGHARLAYSAAVLNVRSCGSKPARNCDSSNSINLQQSHWRSNNTSLQH